MILCTRLMKLQSRSHQRALLPIAGTAAAFDRANSMLFFTGG